MEPELCENDLLYCDGNDSDECEIEIVVRIRKPYTIRPRPDLLNGYDDTEFIRRFRFRKHTVLMILALIEEQIRSKSDR